MTSTSEYDFSIPPEKIAQRPRPFGEHKLLVYQKGPNTIQHTSFESLTSILKEGDLLVMNNTKVVPAQIRTTGDSSGMCPSVLILNPLHPSVSHPNQYDVILAKACEVGTVLSLPEGASITIDSLVGGEPAVHKGTLNDMPEDDDELVDYLARLGEMPLPPYIDRPPDAEDNTAYQTSVASDVGAIAAPTAGLHFYPELLERLKAKGIEIVFITLHVGYGTFRGFTTDSIEEHKMDHERYTINVDSYTSIKNAMNEKRRIFAVGTTSTRVLETCGDVLLSDHEPETISGHSELFIYPPYQFKVVSGLFTNFHYPKTTVLTLTAACVGSRNELIDHIYKEALENDYMWFSYGDGMLVLPEDKRESFALVEEIKSVAAKEVECAMEIPIEVAVEEEALAVSTEKKMVDVQVDEVTEQDMAASRIQAAMRRKSKSDGQAPTTNEVQATEEPTSADGDAAEEGGEDENAEGSEEIEDNQKDPAMGGMGGMGLLHPIPPDNVKPSFSSPRKVDTVVESTGTGTGELEDKGEDKEKDEE